MPVLVSLVPLYVFIPEFLSGRKLHAPEIAVDHLFPLKPTWALVYGSLYLFLILLPVLVVRTTPAAASWRRRVGAAYGCTRVVDMLVGDPLPRIC